MGHPGDCLPNQPRAAEQIAPCPGLIPLAAPWRLGGSPLIALRLNGTSQAVHQSPASSAPSRQTGTELMGPPRRVTQGQLMPLGANRTHRMGRVAQQQQAPGRCQCGAACHTAPKPLRRLAARRPGKEVVRQPGWKSAAKASAPLPSAASIRPHRPRSASRAGVVRRPLAPMEHAEAACSELEQMNRLSATKRGWARYRNQRMSIGLRS